MERECDVIAREVSGYYDGGGRELWLQLIDEHFHPGGLADTEKLACKAGVGRDTHVLDVCSGMGGPSCYLARTFGCRVTGIDVTDSHYNMAVERARREGLEGQVTYHLGNALDMPFADNSFDIVWGQDAWCHIGPDDKGRLIVLALHNSDDSDGWEWEGEDTAYFHMFAEGMAYPLAINIIYYVMTH